MLFLLLSAPVTAGASWFPGSVTGITIVTV